MHEEPIVRPQRPHLPPTRLAPSRHPGATQPTVTGIFLSIGPSLMPDGHAAEMRSIRIRIPHSLKNRHSPIFDHSGHGFHRGMQPDFGIEFDDLSHGYLQLLAATLVVFVSERNHGIQPVIAAIKLPDDQNRFIRTGWLTGQRTSEESRNQRCQ